MKLCKDEKQHEFMKPHSRNENNKKYECLRSLLNLYSVNFRNVLERGEYGGEKRENDHPIE
jgi:hypothetical protein